MALCEVWNRLDAARRENGEITGVILNVFYKRVYVHLGYGFLEKVYENAMAYELQQSRLGVARQQKIDVTSVA